VRARLRVQSIVATFDFGEEDPRSAWMTKMRRVPLELTALLSLSLSQPGVVILWLSIFCRACISEAREKQAEALSQAQREEDLRRVKAEIQEMKQQLHGKARGAAGGLGTERKMPS
jgi:hypothetical protein